DHVEALPPEQGGEGTFRLDAAANPRRIRITRSEGPNRFAIMDGIYELSGDRLRVCMGEPEEQITEFKSRPGTRILLAEFARPSAAPGTIILPANPDVVPSDSIYSAAAKSATATATRAPAAGTLANMFPIGSSAEILASSDWEWTEPENLGPLINTDKAEGGPTLSGDGLTLIFHSNREDGQGGNDLW